MSSPPMKAIRCLRWLALLTLPIWSCVSRQQRTIVTLDGAYGRADSVDSGCDTGPVVHQVHGQGGGSVAIRHEAENGFMAGARGRLLVGRLLEYEELEYEEDGVPKGGYPDWYTMGSLGARLGIRGPYVGVELGASVLISGVGDAFILPGGRLLIGDLDFLWLEAEVLTVDDPLYFTNLLGFGLGLRHDVLEARFGVTAHGRWLVDRAGYWDGGGLEFADGDGEEDVWGAYLDATGRQGRFSWTAGVLMGKAPGGRLGVEYQLDPKAAD